MSLRTQKNALKIIFKMAAGKRVKPVITLPPTKTFFPESLPDSVRMERALPESVGESSVLINAFLSALANESEVYPHGVVIAKKGKVIGERSFAPYSNDIPHVSYSMCKTIVGMAIGILIDEGKLSLTDKITQIVTEKDYGYRKHRRYDELTVRHLLTMTARVNYKEEGMVSDVDWVKGYFSSHTMKKKQFSYNSMNTFILGVVVRERSGMSLFDFVKEKIFEPLGIYKVFWEKNGQNLEKGGWGLYITPEDMAKLGLLVLNKGEYEGKRIVSEEYISQMVLPHAKVPEYLGNYDYGYHIWTAKKYHAYSFNGIFGQNVIVFPDEEIVVAITSGNNDMFFDNPVFKILKKYFVDRDDIEEIEEAKDEFVPLEIDDGVSGEYIMREERGFAGLMPVMMQTIFNTYTSGIHSITVDKAQETLNFLIKEDDEHEIIFNLDGSYRYFDLNISGNLFRVASRARAEIRGGKTHLLAAVYFVEKASVRYMDIVFEEDNIYIVWHENPGARFLFGILRILKRAIKAHNLPGRLLNNDFLFVLKQSNKVFSPESKGSKCR